MIQQNERTAKKYGPNLPIGAAADALDVHIRTLRIYDEQNLVRPSRSDYNRRLYSEKDIERARFVLFLTRNMAVNIAGVKIILKLMEASKIKPELWMDYIDNMSELIGITKEQQELNKVIMAKRCKGYKVVKKTEKEK